MKFHIFLTPMHLVEIDCESHEQASGIHRFWKENRVIAEFQSCVGWLEVLHDAQRPKASVTPLTIVSNAPPDDPSAA